MIHGHTVFGGRNPRASQIPLTYNVTVRPVHEEKRREGEKDESSREDRLPLASASAGEAER
jgi:hypothetical protein